MDKKIKTIFYGTSEFGLPTVQWLFDNTELLAIVTTPDKPAGREKKLEPSAIKVKGTDLGVEIMQPDTLKSESFNNALKALNLDVAVVASYGKIIPEDILDISRLGSVNIHPSLLPKYRGAVPIQAALLNGDAETGITLIRMDSGIDTGKIIVQRELPIESGENFQMLHDRLSIESAELLSVHLPRYINGVIELEVQDEEHASYVPKLSKDDGRLNWSDDPEKIVRQVRALNPWPGTWCEVKGKPNERVKFFNLHIDPESHDVLLGECAAIDGSLYVGTATLTLKIDELQPSGGRRMSGTEFALGLGTKKMLLI